ncbi:MAG: hypothetical protein BGO26_16980 [Actinobacteria bacterium 69-20]|nr:ricin-type beta-trefoil lectin domain protein [Actinomycetota bacterium]OJV27148.1 MAG: hypothetical protein BGO26_16980 [Actinobacteria bacterium 69-20]
MNVIRSRFSVRGTDRGSLPMAMLVAVIGIALAALMVPLVINQAHTTTFDTARGRTLQAAESGIDVALGQVRAATSPNKDGVMQGDAKKLPCGPLAGSVGNGSNDRYSVDIAYYTADPNAHDTQWGIDHKMICVSGYGVRDTATNSYTPSYVVLTSQGSDTAGESRTLVTTYVVKTTNTNIPGGPIRIWPAGSDNYCMDAGSSPVAGSAVKLSLCPTGNQALPKGMSFIYNPDLTIQLAATIGDTTVNANGYGLCVYSAGSSGNAVTLAKCNAPGSPPYQQVWSVDDSSHLRNSNSGKTDVGGQCITAASQTAGTALALTNCAGGTTDTAQTWIPSPAVGAGQAGATNSQLVNFQQFGRCLDVTNQSVSGANSGAQFLILYTCKQNPDPTKVAWNQKFTPTPALTTGSAPQSNQWVTNNGSKYCLTSPGTEGGYVTVTPCASSGATKTAQTWTTYQTQDASGNELAYKDKFTIRDSSSPGRCLSLSKTTDLYNNQYQKAIVETCDGSSQQKWNAQANVQEPVLENMHEQ